MKENQSEISELLIQKQDVLITWNKIFNFISNTFADMLKFCSVNYVVDLSQNLCAVKL